MRLAILYNLREKSGAKIKNWQSYSNPRDQIRQMDLAIFIFLLGSIEVLNAKPGLLPSVTFRDSGRTVFSTKFSTVFLETRKLIIHKK